VFTRYLAPVVLLAFSSLDSLAVIERTVERTFPVEHRAIVKVDTFYGSIQVKPTDRPEVKVLVRESIEAATPSAADRELRDLVLLLEKQPDGVVNLRASYKKTMRWAWQKWPPIGLQIEVWVPGAANLELVSREGQINVGNFQGEVKIRAMQGRVFAGEIDGPLSIWAGKGDIAVTACTGELNLTARGGNVVVGRALGPTEISGVGGEVEVQAASAALHAASDGSDMKVGFAYPLKGDSRLSVSGGDMVVTFDPRTSATLDVRASTFGKISARELGLKIVSGELGTSRLQANLNGGGSRVEIQSSGGSVRLLGVPAMPAH